MFGKWRDLVRDRSGRALFKMAFGSCLLAIAVASTTPAFQTSPLIGEVVTEMREHLPATLDTARRAMGGE